MRSMVRSCLAALGAVVSLTVVSTALAQPAPGPGQPPDPNSSPTGGTTPQPGLTLGTGTSTGANDKVNDTPPAEAPKKAPARVPWRGSSITLGYSATTTAWGVGKDYIGADEQVQSFGAGFLFNYFLKDKGKVKVRAQTSIGFDVELTDGDTTTKHEPQMRDMPLQLIVSAPIARSADKEWSLSGTINGTVLLPTSPASQNNGTYFTASPRALLGAQVPLLGLGSDHSILHSVFVGVSGRLDHRFTKANVPVNEDLNRPRQVGTGSVIASDQLTGGAITRNSVRTGGFLFFDEKILNRPLWLFVATSWIFNFKDDVTSTGSIPIATGAATVAGTPDRRTATNATLFNVGVTYFPMVEWGVGFDYTNNTSQLGPDGSRRNFFYSPAAEFSASLIISVDAIYERLTGPERDEPYVLFGKSKNRAPSTLTSAF